MNGLLDATVTPRSNQNQFKVTPGVKISMKKLQNTFQQLNKKELDGKISVEVPVTVFRDKTYKIEFVLDDDGRGTYFFYCTPGNGGIDET